MYSVIKPKYFDKFVCIGNKCEDNCCKDWLIDVDKETYKKYLICKNQEFKNRLQENIVIIKDENENTKAFFNLDNGKCAFLDKDNLCSIYKNMGEDSMPNTCKIYPRIHNVVNGNIEKGLTTSCIEVAKLVLLDKEGITFEQSAESFDLDKINIHNIIDDYNDFNMIEKYFDKINIISINIIQNRSLSIEKRLFVLGNFCFEVNQNINDEKKLINVIEMFSKFNVENLSYKDLFDKSLENQFEFFVDFINDLLNKKQINNKNFINYLEIINNHIKNKESKNITQIYKRYEKFIKNKEYIYENYIVNYIYIKNFPYSNFSCFETYKIMAFNYFVMKFFVVILYDFNKGKFDENDLVKFIQSYSLVMLHDLVFEEKIKNYFTNIS